MMVIETGRKHDIEAGAARHFRHQGHVVYDRRSPFTPQAEEFLREFGLRYTADDVIASLESLPGVKAAAMSSGIPFGAGSYTTTPATTAPP